MLKVPLADDLPELKFRFEGLSGNREDPGLHGKFRSLPERIAAAYAYPLLVVAAGDTEEEARPANFWLLNAEPRIWIRLFNRQLPLIPANGCILVNDIHKTARHTHKWQRICNHPRVRLSIDLYGMGVIFFREEFREKQHFVLRF
jgi:hypothetical protein